MEAASQYQLTTHEGNYYHVAIDSHTVNVLGKIVFANGINDDVYALTIGDL